MLEIEALIGVVFIIKLGKGGESSKMFMVWSWEKEINFAQGRGSNMVLANAHQQDDDTGKGKWSFGRKHSSIRLNDRFDPRLGWQE